MLRRYPKWLILIAETLFFIGLYLGLRTWLHRDVIHGEAPAFDAQWLQGGEFSLSDYRGAPVLLHFWASWCAVCRIEQGSIASIAEDWPVVTVAMQSGAAGEVRRYMDEHELAFPVLIDEQGGLARLYGVTGVPISFVIDADGRIRFTEVGYTTELGLRSRLWWVTGTASADGV
jgi:peroxiredoxin